MNMYGSLMRVMKCLSDNLLSTYMSRLCMCNIEVEVCFEKKAPFFVSVSISHSLLHLSDDRSRQTVTHFECEVYEGRHTEGEDFLFFEAYLHLNVAHA